MSKRTKWYIGVGSLLIGFGLLGVPGAIKSQAEQPLLVETAGTVENVQAILLPESEIKEKQEDGSMNTESWYAQASAKALEKYFGLDGDVNLYRTKLQYMPAIPEIGFEPSISVLIWPKGESDPQAEMTSEDVMKSHDLLFAEDGSLKSIFYKENSSERLQTPSDVEDAKRIAKEFMLNHKLAGDSQIECLGGAFIASESITVVFCYDNQVIELGVNSRTGKVYYFEYTTKERAMKRITPVEAGFGIG